ncbi:MAG TPA: hypothetical protein VF021_06135 [Longimicrobiales bacterium]
MPKCLLLVALATATASAAAQTPRVPLDVSGVTASGPARVGAGIADEGRRALLRGQEVGSFTLWTANHVIRDVRLSFETTGPNQVIAGSSIAKSVVARPEGTTIVYSHPAFTVREHIFVTLNAPAALILLQVDAVQPLNIIVHTGSGDRVVAIDPAQAAREYYPVVIAAPNVRLSGTARQYWQEKAAHFRRVRSDAISIETPDPRINQALEWAKANLDQRLDRMVHVDAARYYAPFFILAVFERWIASGDDAFLRTSWPEVLRALHFELEDSVTHLVPAGLRPAELDAVQQMARAMGDPAAERAAADTAADTTGWLLPGLAFGRFDDEFAEGVLSNIASSQYTTDWGTRIERDGPVSSFATGLAALAHYRQHRGWAGLDLLRDLSRATFDFTRGRPPHLLSGAYYQTMPAFAPHFMFATSLLVAPVVRGLIGWETDAPHRAAALEPHLPADFPEMAVSGLRVGRDRLGVTLARENGVYSISVHRLTAGQPLALRVAPALPLGAHVDRIVVNDQDVPVQSEESLHDVHAVAEVQLLQDAQIEVHYHGGMDVVSTIERVDVGEATHELKILDFRRDGGDYVVTVEGVAASLYTVELRSNLRVRAVTGGASFEQKSNRVIIRTMLPSGIGYVRKTLRIRV